MRDFVDGGRRWEMRLSQYSTCEKKVMLTARLLALPVGEKGVNAASHLCPHCSRSRAVSESAKPRPKTGSVPRWKCIVRGFGDIGRPVSVITA